MPLRRVDVRQAGADALGILVPHGTRTLVILRPRMLAWDLLPVRWNGDPASPPTFCTFTREDAARVARQLGQYLEACDSAGTHAIETLGRDGAFQIWLRGDEHSSARRRAAKSGTLRRGRASRWRACRPSRTLRDIVQVAGRRGRRLRE